MLVETEFSKTFSWVVERSNLDIIVGMPQTWKIFQATLSCRWLPKISWRHSKRGREGIPANVFKLCYSGLGIRECRFSPILPRNSISCVLGWNAARVFTGSDPRSSNKGSSILGLIGCGRLSPQGVRTQMCLHNSLVLCSSVLTQLIWITAETAHSARILSVHVLSLLEAGRTV